MTGHPKPDDPDTTACIDWETGAWRRFPGKTPGAEIILTGDWAPIRAFSNTIEKKPPAIYGDLLPVLQNSDLRITNLECPLTGAGAPVDKSGAVLKGTPRHLAGLTAVPFDVVTLANNHVFDYGTAGFDETRSLLDAGGIRHVGAGATLAEAEKPLVVTVNGIRIGIINFSEGEDLTAAGPGAPGVLGWEIDRVVAHIAAIRQAVHAVIVICHGGVEYIPCPPPYLADALKRIAESGADLIIGHHPHVPQGVEIHQGVPICYSLGNFVFFQPTDLFYRKIGYMVKAAVAENGLAALTLIPYQITMQGLLRLTGPSLRRTLTLLDNLSAPLETAGGIDAAWHGFLQFYGVAGFRAEIGRIMNRLEREPSRGAAMFRNRLTTRQHRHHLIDLMTRIMDGTLGDAPAWAVAQAAGFFTRKVSDGFADPDKF